MQPKFMQLSISVLALAVCQTLYAAETNLKPNQASNPEQVTNAASSTININPQQFKLLGTIDKRYQSYNVEMVEVVGGEFWRPYSQMDELPDPAQGYDVSQKDNPMYRTLQPIDLKDKKLINLAKALGPAYMRVSGTWANAVYFQDNDQPAMKEPPKGFVNVLTAKQWQNVLDFAKATDAKLVTSFAVSKGVRDENGTWTPKEAQKILNYTRKHGSEIYAAELFNEPNIPSSGGEMPKDYNARDYAKDIAAFNAWASKAAPKMLKVGPGTIGEGIDEVDEQALGKQMGIQPLKTEDMLAAYPRPKYDVFSYHFYGAASMRMMQEGPFSIKADKALEPAWLERTDQAAAHQIRLRDKYVPNKPIWNTETAQAAAGGDPYSATYLDTFRYLYQNGTLAKHGVQAVMHNTLAASEYSLIDQDSHLPKPNYWAALLWAKLMGNQVYDAGQGRDGVYLFAHSNKTNPRGKTLLVINSNDTATRIKLPKAAQAYHLTADRLTATEVKLNGQTLALTADDKLPTLHGQATKAGEVVIEPYSSVFLTF